jgi:hypothetical protein
MPQEPAIDEAHGAKRLEVGHELMVEVGRVIPAYAQDAPALGEPRLSRAGRCWGNRESPVEWPVLFTCHSNPEKPPYACQTATRHLSR